MLRIWIEQLDTLNVQRSHQSAKLSIIIVTIIVHVTCIYAGVVPANGKVDIFITFTPAEYSTATIELQVS